MYNLLIHFDYLLFIILSFGFILQMNFAIILVEFLFFLNFLSGYRFHYFFLPLIFQIYFQVENILHFLNPTIIIITPKISLLFPKDLLRRQFRYVCLL